MSGSDEKWAWREVTWPRPFDPDAAIELLDHLASDRSLGPLIWETRSRKGRVRNLVSTHASQIGDMVQLIKTLVPGARVAPVSAADRTPVQMASRVLVSHHSLALNVDRVTAVTRSVLAGLTSAKAKDEELVLQVMLGARISPALLPGKVADPRASWLDLIRGTVQAASAETRTSMKTRASLHGFKLTVRVGAVAGTPGRMRVLIAGVLSGLRVAEAAGVRLRFVAEPVSALDQLHRPWRWPLQLSARELVGLMGWPLGEGPLPGVSGEHPRVVAPPEGLRSSDRAFAVSSAAGETVRLGVSARDSLQHTVLLGPTGSGKSNAMLNLITADINAGRSVIVIDPKTDLNSEVLARIPESRKNDVVVIDPADARPVGLNPFTSAQGNRELVADSILAVFKELFSDSWGPRTQDVLTSALITLAHHKGATLTMLPSLLTDASLRKKLTRGLTDRIGLGPFWAAYEAMSVEQRTQVIAPVMNKLRQFLLRPALRAVLGQSEPLFELADLFTKRRIVLVSLNKGLIGSEGARLLGALVVSQLWPLTLARSKVTPERRHLVSVYIDEVQDYLALPTDLADALSQARGFGVGFTIAHQYRNQLPLTLRAGVDANARNKIVFGLNAGDAAEVAKMAPGLDAQDFMLLPRYGVYALLMDGGHSTGWISGRTLPAVQATSDPVELKNMSARSYGRQAAEVELEVLRSIGLDGAGEEDRPDEPIGRRPRTPDRRTQ